MTTLLDSASGVIAPSPALPAPPVFEDPADERLLRKRELAAAFRLFGRFGFSEGVAGHITARDPEHPDRFWVNPFGMSFNQIKVSDLILVDHTGAVVEGDKPVNRAAFAIHSEVHKARPDVIAAAHAHSLHGKAFASLGIPLDPITQDAAIFYEDQGLYAEFGGVASSVEGGRRIAKAVGETKAAILQNHGLITVGHSVGEAAWWFITMERSCQAQLLAMAAGTPKLIEPEIARTVRDEIGNHFAGWFSFRPLWDQITEGRPDLFD
ncbi:class II aldolase/adducin family protein [Pseudonocardia acaciae]|uniref:class II aldolase/adducin family protein n=1 Tax=Pseudonocardia acaciae TaxID=551276 RepID=UPI00048AC750|nr:class II aldolase/adducin family protein [Pseudonocardia acaciae]